MASKSQKIQFETKIAKYKRINVPKPFYQIKDGQTVRVTLEVVETVS